MKAHAWKVCIRETVSRVRIPLPPPTSLGIRSEALAEVCALKFCRKHRDIATEKAVESNPEAFSLSVNSGTNAQFSPGLDAALRMHIRQLLARRDVVIFTPAPSSRLYRVAIARRVPRWAQ